MRHAITVVGCEEQRSDPMPEIVLRDNEEVRMSTWNMAAQQQDPSPLLDDHPSLLVRLLSAPLHAYRFYLHVHGIKLWSGKRPLIVVRDRRLSATVAAYAGRWGGGDVVMPSDLIDSPLGPTRYFRLPNGQLKLRED